MYITLVHVVGKRKHFSGRFNFANGLNRYMYVYL